MGLYSKQLSSLLVLSLSATMGAAKAQTEAPPEATRQAQANEIREDAASRFRVLSRMLQQRIADNILTISELSRERTDLLKPTGGSEAAPPADIEAIDQRIDGLRREVDVLRTELVALIASPAEMTAPQMIADEPDEAVQEALIYLGHYDGRIDGKIGQRSRDAIAEYQQTLGKEPTGELTDLERRQLLDQAAIRRQAHGMRVAGGEDMPYQFVYPSRLLSREQQEGTGYHRFSTPSDDANLQIVSDTADRLETIFAGLVGRADFAVDYQRLRDDWLVVSGKVDDMIFYDIARRSQRSLVHVRLAFPAAERALWDPMTVILFNSFRLDPMDQPVAPIEAGTRL